MPGECSTDPCKTFQKNSSQHLEFFWGLGRPSHQNTWVQPKSLGFLGPTQVIGKPVISPSHQKHLEKFSHPEPPKSFQHLEIFQGPSQPPHPNSTRTGFWCLQPYHSPSQAPTKGGGRPGNNSPKSLQHLEIFRTPHTYPPNPTRNMDPRWLPPPNMAGSMPQGLI